MSVITAVIFVISPVMSFGFIVLSFILRILEMRTCVNSLCIYNNVEKLRIKIELCIQSYLTYTPTGYIMKADTP